MCVWNFSCRKLNVLVAWLAVGCVVLMLRIGTKEYVMGGLPLAHVHGVRLSDDQGSGSKAHFGQAYQEECNRGSEYSRTWEELHIQSIAFAKLLPKTTESRSPSLSQPSKANKTVEDKQKKVSASRAIGNRAKETINRMLRSTQKALNPSKETAKMIAATA